MEVPRWLLEDPVQDWAPNPDRQTTAKFNRLTEYGASATHLRYRAIQRLADP